jgi:hypothetical protein
MDIEFMKFWRMVVENFLKANVSMSSLNEPQISSIFLHIRFSAAMTTVKRRVCALSKQLLRK